MPHARPRRLRDELGATARLALPLIAGQLSAVGMNVVDALLAGHLDAHTLGAVAIGTSIWSLAIVAIIGVMMALPPSVAQLHGGGRDSEIGALFRQGVWLATGLGVVLFLVVRFGAGVLVGAIELAPELVPDVLRFVHAIAWGAPALAGYFALRGLCEGVGVTRPTMYFGLFGLVLLLPVGWILMYGKLGFPRLGALGSGIATALVLWVEVLAFALYVARSRRLRALAPFARFEPPSWPAIRSLLHIGVPMGITLLMEAGLFVAVALSIGTLGTDVVAGHQIALNVASVAFMIPLGVAMATTVRVGHAAGAGNLAGVRAAGRAGIVLTFATQAVSAGIMLLFPAWIASLYSNDAPVVGLAAQLLVLAALFQFPDGIQVAANGALRGLKDTRVPMLLTLFAYWMVGMPVGWWLAFPRGLGARGMWMGLIVGLTVAAVLLPTRFWRRTRAGLTSLQSAGHR